MEGLGSPEATPNLDVESRGPNHTTTISLDFIHPWELINEKLKLQMENALDIVKRAIFKEIVEFTLLKRFAVVPPSL